MQLLSTPEGTKKSITIQGLKDWKWCPNRNLLIYTTFFEEDDDTQMVPQIGFMKIPTRHVISVANIKDAETLKMYVHPQGSYLAVYNEFKHKKSTKYQVEVFDLNAGDNVPHQQIQIKREVQEFNGLYWEPNNTKLAIHTLAKKDAEPGRQNYTLDAKRNGVDIYEMYNDKQTGFNVRNIGQHPADKVIDFCWSPAGGIFTVCEREGLSLTSKNVWSFYMVNQLESAASVADKSQ